MKTGFAELLKEWQTAAISVSHLRLLLVCFLGIWRLDERAMAQTNYSLQQQSRPPAIAKGGGGTFFGKVPDPAKTHHYYIAAEPELWDYAPEGRDVICGLPLQPSLGGNRREAKLRYIAYTDETFSAKVKPEPGLGILGPVLRGVVGDYLAVTFLNRTSTRVSMHPHGVKYDKESEGASYLPNPGPGAAVEANSSFNYIWKLDEDSGPLPSEPSSKAWLYHSHVQGDQEINQGLIGIIIVTDPRRARRDGTPSDVDRELATLFMIFDESHLAFDEKEAAEYGLAGKPKKSWAEVQQRVEEGSRYAINGRVFGNLSGLEMNEGERVRWYLFALGSERDLHSAHWHGLRVLEDGRRRTDVVELLPASMKVADLKADNPGSWLFHCHVSEHMMEGMFARMTIYPQAAPPSKRAPTPGFLGLPQSFASIQIRSAEASPAAPDRSSEVRLAGSITVYDAFYVSGQPVRIQLGETSVTLTPDKTGSASVNEAAFRMVNGSAYGVVYGGSLEFEIVLRGPEWLAELKKLAGAKAKPTTPISAPFVLEVGSTRHSTTVRFDHLFN